MEAKDGLIISLLGLILAHQVGSVTWPLAAMTMFFAAFLAFGLLRSIAQHAINIWRAWFPSRR